MYRCVMKRSITHISIYLRGGSHITIIYFDRYQSDYEISIQSIEIAIKTDVLQYATRYISIYILFFSSNL